MSWQTLGQYWPLSRSSQTRTVPSREEETTPSTAGSTTRPVTSAVLPYS